MNDTLSLVKVSEKGKKKPTGKEKDRFYSETRHLEGEFLNGHLEPKTMLNALQKVAEGFCFPGELDVNSLPIFENEPIRCPHLEHMGDHHLMVPPNFLLDDCKDMSGLLKKFAGPFLERADLPASSDVFAHCNPKINDVNFPLASLLKGRKYVAEVYRVSVELRNNPVLSWYRILCLAKLQKRILPGVFGAAWMAIYGTVEGIGMVPRMEDRNMRLVFLDAEEHLYSPTGSGAQFVPTLLHCTGGWVFDLEIAWYTCLVRDYVVLLREMPPTH